MLLVHAMQVELPPGTSDDVYLQKLQQALEAAAVMMPQPQLIIYNAGTDILAGDPLGRYGWLVARAEGVEVVEEFKWWPGLRGLGLWMCLVDRQA